MNATKSAAESKRRKTRSLLLSDASYRRGYHMGYSRCARVLAECRAELERLRNTLRNRGVIEGRKP